MMTARLLQVTIALLHIIRSGITEDSPLQALLLSSTSTDISTVQDLQRQMSLRGVKLQLTVTMTDVSDPFIAVSEVCTQLQGVKLILLTSSLCHSQGSLAWLESLNIPYICDIESAREPIDMLIFMYSKNCLGKTRPVPSLIECMEVQKLQSSLTTENVLETLITTLKWTIVTIFFEDKMDRVATSVISELSRKRVQCLMYRLNSNQTDEDITKLISHVISLVPVEQRNFLLLCDSACATRVLEKANEFNDRATAMRMMSSWLLLIFMENFNSFQIPDLALDNVAMVGAHRCHCHAAVGNGSSTAVVSTLMYKATSRQWNTVGYLNSSGHLVLQDTVFPNRQFGFNKRKLIVSTLRLAPYAYAHVDENNKTTFDGFCMDLLKELSITFNFTYEVREPEDMEWGRMLNGSWTGIVGMMERLEADMAVAPLIISKERETVMDFTYPYYYDQGAGLYKLPDETSSKSFTLVKPFKLEVFLCLGAVFLVVGFLLIASEYVYLRQKKMSTVVTDLLESCILQTAGIFLKQANRKRPACGTGHVLVGCLWFFCIIVVAAYSGNLIAFLTVTKTYPPFRTLEEVAQQDEYVMGTDGGSMWRTLFESSNTSDYQMTWSGIMSNAESKPDVLSTSLPRHRQLVEEGSYIFFFDRDAIVMWAQDDCDLVLLEETFYQITYGVGLPENSPYGRMFSEKMLKIEGSGLLQIWKGNWWPNGSKCAGKMQVQAKAIELIDLQSAFYVLGIGASTALLVLFIENLWRWFPACVSVLRTH